MDETFLTTEEVLAYLQVNLRTVYRLIKAGKIPPCASAVSGDSASATSTRWLDSQRPRGGAKARYGGGHAGARRRAASARPSARASSSSTTSRASATCWQRRCRSRITTSIPRRMAARRSSVCGCMPYDLLIVDLKMPGIDGLTVIREAKRLKADLPVIVITGFSTESAAIEALNLGVTELSDETISRSAGARSRCEGDWRTG